MVAGQSTEEKKESKNLVPTIMPSQIGGYCHLLL
jgi:hypothetical protein